MTKEQIAILVQKARQGDGTAMSSLMEIAYDSVIFQCRKIMKHPEDAEDMAQEVLLQVYLNLDKLQDPEKFRGWANRIAAHMCLNKRQRHPKDLQFLEDEDGNSFLDNLEDVDRYRSPDAALDTKETRRLLTVLLDELPEVQREAICLYIYAEMSVREIAQLTGVSENTVKSRLRYARKALEEGVLGYEKDGVKLYSVSVLPFLLALLRRAAEDCADPAARAAAIRAVLQGGAAAGGAAAGTAAATAETASGTAAASGGAAAAEGAAAAASTAGAAGTAAGTAAAAGGTDATGLLGAVSVKVVAAVLAGVVAVGGIAAGVAGSSKREETTPVRDTEQTLEEPETVEPPVDPEPPESDDTTEAVPEDLSGPVPMASYTTRRTTVVPVEEIGFIGIELETPLFDEVNEGYRKINEYFDAIHDNFAPETNENVATMLSIYESGSEQAEYIASFRVVYQDEYYVSLRMSESIWPLESFPMGGRTGWTFDVRTGELLELTDLYDGSEAEVAEQIAQVIRDYGYGAYLNSGNYPAAGDGFTLAPETMEEDRDYSQLGRQKGQPLYYWHQADSVNDLCIPLPVTLPELEASEQLAEEQELPNG